MRANNRINAADRRHFSGHRIDAHLFRSGRHFEVSGTELRCYLSRHVPLLGFCRFCLCPERQTEKRFQNAVPVNAAADTVFSSVLLVMQVCLIIWCFANIGLINTHVMFASFPLIVSALSIPLLGEKVGWQRWLAIYLRLYWRSHYPAAGQQCFRAAIVITPSRGNSLCLLSHSDTICVTP